MNETVLSELAQASDALLLSRIAQQDAAALTELFHRYGGRVMAYVRALGGPRFPAEDAVQEIFLTLWQKAGLYAPQGTEAAAWIFTLTRHKVFDIQRSLGRVKEVGNPDLELLFPALEAPDPTLSPSLDKALSMLPNEQQRPLRLAYYGGLSYDQTAQHLQVPLGTLKTRIRTGLASLRHLLSAKVQP